MTTCGDAGGFADGARAGARPGHRGDADSAEVPPGGSRVPARPQRLPSGTGENAGTLGPEREARPGPGHTGRPLGPSSRRRLCPALPGDPARPASSVRAPAPVPGALSSPVSLSLRRPIHPCPHPPRAPRPGPRLAGTGSGPWRRGVVCQAPAFRYGVIPRTFLEAPAGHSTKPRGSAVPCSHFSAAKGRFRFQPKTNVSLVSTIALTAQETEAGYGSSPQTPGALGIPCRAFLKTRAPGTPQTNGQQDLRSGG